MLPGRDRGYLVRSLGLRGRLDCSTESVEDVVVRFVIDDHVWSKSIQLGLESYDVVEEPVSGDTGVDDLDLAATSQSSELCLQLSRPSFVVAANK